MTIKQVNTGAHGRKPRYFIENEGGGTVAHFDSLCTAALVLRYLNGAPMTEEDADMAWDAMQRLLRFSAVCLILPLPLFLLFTKTSIRSGAFFFCAE